MDTAGTSRDRTTSMTPQLAAKLRIHEHETAEALYAAPGAGQGGSLIPLPLSRQRPVDDADNALPSLLRRESLDRRLLGAFDVLAATVALALVLAVLGRNQPGIAAVAGMPLIVVLFKVAGLYDRDRMRILGSTLDEAPMLLQLTGIYALGVTILGPLLLDQALHGGQIAALWLGSFAAVMAGRMLARSLSGRVSAAERCLVIGEPERAERVRHKLISSRARATVVATLPLHGDDIDYVGSPESLRRLAVELKIHRIIIAPTTAEAGGVIELIRIAKAAGVRVSVLPRMLEVVGSAVEFEDVDGMTMLGVRPFGLPRSSRLLKRAFDLVATSIGLLAVAPIIATVAIAIRLESKGPVFFRQVRVGRDGRHFRIYKFRSMVVDAEAQKDRLRQFNEVGDGMFKITADPRVTRVGSILRKTSLDELPQLFNVMRGEMSLVGPRPLVTDEDAQVLGLDRSRLHLTPGMTGPWQILGSRVPMQEMVGIDYLYVASWTLWLDIKVLLRTARHVLRRGNV
jgi:exopolysaccharide biosynthesis polyprenyl glycosylphosphotransferase